MAMHARARSAVRPMTPACQENHKACPLKSTAPETKRGPRAGASIKSKRLAERPAFYNRCSPLSSNGGIIAIGCFQVAVSLAARLRLGATPRALGQLTLDFLDRFGLRHVLNDRDLA